MKPRNILQLLLALCFSTYSFGQAKVMTPASHNVIIRGTSNVHDWDEKVHTVTASASITKGNDRSMTIESLTVKMKVYSIKSTKGKIMDNNTYKALKASQYPDIIFALVAPVRSLDMDRGTYTFKTRGNITIAGVTRQVEMNVKLLSAGGGLVFEGIQKIRMTDYGVEPPVAMMGMMKTGNDITVSYQLTFAENTLVQL